MRGSLLEDAKANCYIERVDFCYEGRKRDAVRMMRTHTHARTHTCTLTLSFAHALSRACRFFYMLDVCAMCVGDDDNDNDDDNDDV